MSLLNISLHKLLAVFYADDQTRRRILKEDIASDRRRLLAVEGSAGGGDFYGPFWADVKTHVGGASDIWDLTNDRIDSNYRRERLYQQLAQGFISWWDDWRRYQNQPILLADSGIRGQLALGNPDRVVRVGNVLALALGGSFTANFVVYPYFRETPALPEEGVRLGLWAAANALSGQFYGDICILDILRGAGSYGSQTLLRGDEEAVFVQRYDEAVAEWQRLHAEPA